MPIGRLTDPEDAAGQAVRRPHEVPGPPQQVVFVLLLLLLSFRNTKNQSLSLPDWKQTLKLQTLPFLFFCPPLSAHDGVPPIDFWNL